MITAIHIELNMLCLVMLYAIAHQSLINVNQQMKRVLFRCLVYGVIVELVLDSLCVVQVDTASEALALSIGERAKVDLPFMSSLCGKSEQEITEELRGVIFQNPNTHEWETGDEYLSGLLHAQPRPFLHRGQHRDQFFGTHHFQQIVLLRISGLK